MLSRSWRAFAEVTQRTRPARAEALYRSRVIFASEPSLSLAPMDVSPRAIYSIGAVARMLEVAAGDAAVVGGPLRTCGTRARRGRPAPVQPATSSSSSVSWWHRWDQAYRPRMLTACWPSGCGEDGSRWPAVPQTAARVVILLAERDPYAAEFSDYFLRTEGYEIVTTLDAQDAEAQFEGKAPHVLIVDMQISGGAGPALCRAFKERGGSRSWPFRHSSPGTRPWRAAPTPSCKSRWTPCSSSPPSRTCS